MNVEIAQRLAELRREKGYSQEELAENLGLSRQAVSKWERAESSPDTGNLVALARLYGVSLDDLLQVNTDIEDDMKFETQDKETSAESKARVAAEQATAAAAQASAAAVQAQAQAASASDSAQRVAGRSNTAPFQPQGHPVPPYQGQPIPPYQGQPIPPQHNVAGKDHEKKQGGPWVSFPYPIICVIIFLCIGFFLGAWHPGWVVFLTIPLYYWIANIIENDPNYQASTQNKGKQKTNSQNKNTQTTNTQSNTNQGE